MTTPIVHITPKEQALMRENERLTQALRISAFTVETQAEQIEGWKADQRENIEITFKQQAEINALKADLFPLQRFMDSVIGEFPEHGDLDGLTLQEMAESCGLLVLETRTEPCGEQCACRDYGTSVKWDCYRVQPVMRRARIASAQHDAAMEDSK